MRVLGRYPPPPGVTDILGVEVSGVVVSRRPLLAETQASDAVIHVGSPVMALLDGGGYATHVIVDERLCLPVPKSLSLLQVTYYTLPHRFSAQRCTAIIYVPCLALLRVVTPVRYYSALFR